VRSAIRVKVHPASANGTRLAQRLWTRGAACGRHTPPHGSGSPDSSQRNVIGPRNIAYDYRGYIVVVYIKLKNSYGPSACL